MILFYILIWVMPLSQHPIWGRSVGELTVVKYLGAACVFYAFLHVCVRRTFPSFFRTWQARLFLLFYFIVIVSHLTKSTGIEWGGNPFTSYTSYFLLFFVTVAVVDSLDRLRWALLSIIGSVAFASFYVLREWQKYHNVYADFRPGWVVGDSNYFAASALLSLLLAFHLMLGRRPRWERLFCLGCLLITLVAVTLCASRGSFLGLATAFLFVIWRSRQRVRNLVLATVFVLPLSLVLPISPLQRFLLPNYADKLSEQSHIAAWKAGVRMIQAHPLVGIGLANFKPMMPLYSDYEEKVESMAHNVYLEIAAEMGLPSLVVFLAILYFSFKTLERQRTLHSSSTLLYEATAGIQAGLVGYAVASLFLSAEYQKLFWLALFLAMCLPSLVPAANVLVGEAGTGPRNCERVEAMESLPREYSRY